MILFSPKYLNLSSQEIGNRILLDGCERMKTEVLAVSAYVSLFKREGSRYRPGILILQLPAFLAGRRMSRASYHLLACPNNRKKAVQTGQFIHSFKS
jgi:hypothetical protein